MIKDSNDRIWRASTIINFIVQYKNAKNIVQKLSKEIITYENEKKQTIKSLFEAQKNIIEDEVVNWMNDTDKTQKLCGYDWIIEQWNSSF